MCGGNPRDSGLGDLQGYIQAIIESNSKLDPTQRYSGLRIDPSKTPTQGGLDALTNQYFNTAGQNINRNVMEAGQQGASRGYSMGLTNPFAFAQHAENQARGALGSLEGDRARQLMQNPLTAFGAGAQTTQFNTDLLLRLIGAKGGFTMGREGNVAADSLGALLGGAGQVGGAYLTGGASGGSSAGLGNRSYENGYID